jgi:hypothetical protein
VPGSLFPINSFESYTSRRSPTGSSAGTTIALFLYNLQDWLPGVAGPNLDSDPVFWGVSSKKGACTSPLFHFFRGGWPVRDFASRECVIEVVQFGGPNPLGPSFFAPLRARRSRRPSVARPSAEPYSKLSTCFVFACPPATLPYASTAFSNATISSGGGFKCPVSKP